MNRSLRMGHGEAELHLLAVGWDASSCLPAVSVLCLPRTPSSHPPPLLLQIPLFFLATVFFLYSIYLGSYSDSSSSPLFTCSSLPLSSSLCFKILILFSLLASSPQFLKLPSLQFFFPTTLPPILSMDKITHSPEQQKDPKNYPLISFSSLPE